MQEGFGYQEQPQVQSVPVTSDELYAQQIQKEEVRNILSQIDPENQLYEIMMRIKGYYKHPDQGWTRIDKDFEVKDLLIARYISYLSSLMNQSTTFSNLSAEQINRIMKLSIEYVVDDLDNHSDEYGLGENYTERTRIATIICNCIFMVMNRALNGGEARRFWSSIDLGESYNYNPSVQKKKGLMESLAFWK